MHWVTGVITVAVLGVALVATAAHAFGLPLGKVVRSPTLMRFVPQWNFFAPLPGVHDYELYYRDQLVTGSMGPWRQVLMFPRRRLLDAVWNPNSRELKAWLDLVPELSQAASALRDRPGDLQLTVPYLLVVSYAAHLPRSDLSAARQVMITRGAPGVDAELLFVSSLHSL